MKTRSQQLSSEQASALIVTLVVGVILLTVMVGYLSTLGTHDKLVVRSESWNASLTMAEAGVEEAMAQINSSSPPNLSGNGWGGSAGVYGPVSRTLSGGSYSVSITTNNALTPVICATGYITVPVSGDIVSRAVRCTTAWQVLANVGVGARNNINMTGTGPAGGIAVNSFSSTNPLLSTAGQYDPSKATTNGNVASMGGIVSISGHTIEGDLYLGPGASFDAKNGTVTGTTYTDANINFPDVSLPNVTWSAAPLASGTHTFTTSGNYIVSDQSPIVVQAGVTVNLDVTTTVDYSPTSISIHGGMTNSGTANVYLNGPPSMTLTGNSAVDAGNRAGNLNYYGLPSLTTVNYKGTSTFVGTLYAPDATVNLKGGGNSNDFIGSLVAGTLNLDGHYNIHYDQALSSSSPPLAVISSWQEL